MTGSSDAPHPIDDAATTIATFPNPYEAELARAALESQGVAAVVHNDHGQYLSAGSWVQLQVPRGDSARAATLLEQGPLHADVGADESEAADDMGSARLQRRFALGRWFLYAGALPFLLSGLLLPVSVAELGLALWSRRSPRRAFAFACVLQSIVAFVSIATSGLVGLGLLIPLLAFHLAWASAAPAPRPGLAASPYPRTPSIDVGESWQASEARDEQTEPPAWILRDLGLLAATIVLVAVLSIALRSG